MNALLLLLLAMVAGSLTLTLGEYEETKDLDADDEDAEQLLNIIAKSREPKDYHMVAELDLKLRKKIGFIWITVPCHMIPGGCHRANICEALAPITCPADYQTCHCPFKQGVYTLTPTTIAVPMGGVPSGDYRLTAWLMQGSTELGCIHMQLAVA